MLEPTLEYWVNSLSAISCSLVSDADDLVDGAALCDARQGRALSRIDLESVEL